MIKKIQQYLLTHTPLLWNTRIVWLLACLFVIHIFFFLSGFGGISVKDFRYQDSWLSTGGVSLYIFSILCSLAVIICWLVFYLRNNAFKSFYIIRPYHLTKEFILVFTSFFLIIMFFESYQWGARLKTRSITSQEQLVKDVNILNLANAFIPRSKSEYFKLNNCDSGEDSRWYYNDGTDYFDTSNFNYDDTANIKIRAALLLPDAFSYRNHCANSIRLRSYPGYTSATERSVIINRWIDNHRIDSIIYILDECLAISKKYNVLQDFKPKELAQLVFANPYNNVTRTIANSEAYSYQENQPVDFFNEYALSNALEYTDRCYLGDTGYDEYSDRLLFMLYTALCLSILLVTFRFYSRKVFLLGVLGTILWSIVFALVGSAGADIDGIGILYLFLFMFFLLGSLLLLSRGGNKLLTGLFLNWHIYMLPFMIMIIIGITEYTYFRYNRTLPGLIITEEMLRQRHPVAYWITHHIMLLSWLNLLFVFLYTAFCFPRLSKKWHSLPEE